MALKPFLAIYADRDTCKHAIVDLATGQERFVLDTFGGDYGHSIYPIGGGKFVETDYDWGNVQVLGADFTREKFTGGNINYQAGALRFGTIAPTGEVYLKSGTDLYKKDLNAGPYHYSFVCSLPANVKQIKWVNYTGVPHIFVTADSGGYQLFYRPVSLLNGTWSQINLNNRFNNPHNNYKMAVTPTHLCVFPHQSGYDIMTGEVMVDRIDLTTGSWDTSFVADVDFGTGFGSGCDDSGETVVHGSKFPIYANEQAGPNHYYLEFDGTAGTFTRSAAIVATGNVDVGNVRYTLNGSGNSFNINPLNGNPIFEAETYPDYTNDQVTKFRSYVEVDKTTGAVVREVWRKNNSHGDPTSSPYGTSILQLDHHTITGTVTDGTPVENARVQLVGANGNPSVYTLTDANGDYVLHLPLGGEQRITCTLPTGEARTHMITPVSA